MRPNWAWLTSLLGLTRVRKRLVMVIADAVCIPIVMYVAHVLKADAWIPVSAGLMVSVATAALVCIPIFAWLGLYRAVVRYMGPKAALAVAIGVSASVVTLLVLSSLGGPAVAPATTTIVFGALLLTYVGASRMLLRWLLLANGRTGPRVVIYGAGQGGAELATALLATGEFVPVAFVDDNPALWGTVIAGILIHDPAYLPALLDEFRIRRVLLAMPALSRRRRREILSHLAPLGVHVQTIPTVADLLSGTARVDDIQDVDVTDLLGRDPVPPIQRLFQACIRGKTVMVTGAGGSIGSELCRQIVQLEPTRLLLFEMSELALYNIERELRRLIDVKELTVDLVPLLGNAHHKYRVREILQTFGVQTVYHAAAYKHVPIVEQNLIEGLHNNVFSTWHTAEAALECGVEAFVLVSTDKAVNPPNVMGATKRFAEIVLQGLQQRSTGTRFCMVRFGNVLESSGSVVPLFRDQIRRGGPVTVTHPDVIRYFMTIPEAAQLVIQAGSMAEGGDVFVLDMGKPIRIVDLARRMIQLSGLTVRDDKDPNGDIEVAYTGLRPAEKLFEELLIGKNVTGTEHSMIMRAVEHALPWDDIQQLLGELTVAMRRFDCRAARDLLARAVAEYQPHPEIQDTVWRRRAEVPIVGAMTEAKITDLQARRAGRAGAPGANAGVPD
jgi:FlaA1/EpsC-like NDP-sugar epimerase